jgi:hypothetical protein
MLSFLRENCPEMLYLGVRGEVVPSVKTAGPLLFFASLAPQNNPQRAGGTKGREK